VRAYPIWNFAENGFFDQVDQVRRWQGQLLDMLGLGPIETPSRVVFSAPALTLKAYAHDGQAGPPLLIVPAPIKRAYIWDLLPWASVVQQCLRHGIRVYLIQWEQPEADGQGFGLAAYADQFILSCLDNIKTELGQPRAFLAGHSLGGTLAAMFAALHPERIQGLTLLGAPLRFGPDVGAFGPLVALAPRPQIVTALLGNVPGSFLNTVSICASPTSFQGARFADWLTSLIDIQALQTHLRVERWTLDELPLARQLFEDLVQLLYRENRFMDGTLMIRGQRAIPALVDAPILSVVDARCRLVPPASVLPFHDAVSSVHKRVLWYMGDTGVSLQHVGMLVGKRAHQYVWPEILQWLHAHSEAG
jgi:polyhydroxyalkanoate synthase